MKSLQNKKGITPIISVILLLMMTIAIAGLAYTWLQRMERSIESSTENTSGEFLKGMNVMLRVEGYFLNCSDSDPPTNITINVKNIGTESATNLQLYADDSFLSGQSNESLTAGSTESYTLDSIIYSDWVNRTRTIKIVSDETVAESTYTIECSSGSYGC